MKCALTNYTDYCVICGDARTDMHHLLPGRANRKMSDKYGLLCPLCRNHHEGAKSVHLDREMMVMGKIIGQLLYEKEYYRNELKLSDDPARQAFRKDFGQSYL